MKKALTFLFLGLGLAGFAQDSYTLAPESTLTIDGTSTVHDWTVAANAMEGTLTATATRPKEINFGINVADIQSERGPAMDKKMHAALKKEEHPKVSFALEEFKGTSTLAGTLSIAGTEKRVEIPAKISTSATGIRISGEQKIILQDFGMEPPTAMFGQIIVGDEVTVKFDLSFAKK